jgi:hypothetical protein
MITPVMLFHAFSIVSSILIDASEQIGPPG